jgi:aminoglycoside phosphotransferase (APT) family kinase protein
MVAAMGAKAAIRYVDSIAELCDRIDGDATLCSWEESLNASVWDGRGVWVHGDLLPGNLLVVDGRLSAVIDFGGLNVGDPACDLQPAWNVFVGDSRMQFRAELEVDDSSWLRGRGWTPYQSVRQDEKFVWAAKALANGTGSIRKPRPASATAYSDLQY